jgi:hypothetical protein
MGSPDDDEDDGFMLGSIKATFVLRLLQQENLKSE